MYTTTKLLQTKLIYRYINQHNKYHVSLILYHYFFPRAFSFLSQEKLYGGKSLSRTKKIVKIEKIGTHGSDLNILPKILFKFATFWTFQMPLLWEKPQRDSDFDTCIIFLPAVLGGRCRDTFWNAHALTWCVLKVQPKHTSIVASLGCYYFDLECEHQSGLW